MIPYPLSSVFSLPLLPIVCPTNEVSLLNFTSAMIKRCTLGSTCDLPKLTIRYPSFVAIQSSLMWFPAHSIWGSSDLGISNAPIRHTEGLITWPYYKKKKKKRKEKKRKKMALLCTERNCQAFYFFTLRKLCQNISHYSANNKINLLELRN